MDNEATLVFDVPQRLAVAADPRWLALSIPGRSLGVYMLLREGQPFYVGRSDNCVLTRLRGHPWLAHASHVVWEPCGSAEQAFWHESAWYHIHGPSGHLRNVVHPARPAEYSKDCPFCDTRDREALEYLLPHLCKQSVATASPTISAVNAKTN